MTAEAKNQYDVPMSDSDFNRITELAYLYTGIVFGPEKKQLVIRQLKRRLSDLGLDKAEDYYPLIDDEDKPEVSKLINALTTSQASFFREQHHFDFLAKTLCPKWQEVNSKSKKIRIWSAGCSSGEEAYSIAMSLLENLDLGEWDCEILATDLDPQIIEKAQKGIYGIDAVSSLTADRMNKWFLFDQNNPDIIQVKPELQALIKFKSLNILDAWPMADTFDLIFCRNMIIYFNQAKQTELFNRYAGVLKEGGYLILGASERLNTGNQNFKLVDKTIYQKNA